MKIKALGRVPTAKKGVSHVADAVVVCDLLFDGEGTLVGIQFPLKYLAEERAHKPGAILTCPDTTRAA